MTTNYYPCTSCGAKLEFAPGQHALKCPYCGAQNAIAEAAPEAAAAAVEELDFQAYLQQQAGNEPVLERQTVKCPGCGAASQLPQNVTADRCPFCAAPLIAADAYAHRSIQPKAIAPFEIKDGDARSRFKQWIDSLWFAPNALKKAYRAESGLKGIYLPYWTYDANTDTPYVGERGEIYFETEVYEEDGQRKTRQVERIRWWPAAGDVRVSFDDVLVPASASVPKDYADKLAPWRLDKLTPYRDDYVSGFTVEAYQMGLEPGFGVAQQEMVPAIEQAIYQDIGGDQQRILSMSPRYFDITFKHILLPIWLSSYRYGDKTYRFLVNGQTGAVQGERPYSAWKIAGAVAWGVAIVLVVLKLAHKI
jgi:predicted Zn-ribbon and HTH transcriptional regulator